MPTRRASAVWEGGLKNGKGSVKTESGVVDWPSQKSVSPTTDVTIGIDAEGLKLLPSRSLMRPAQPVSVAAFAAAFCHSSCWSAWLKRFDGKFCCAVTEARVAGASSVPTLATSAATPLSTS